jgi:hypothetical protein
MVLLALPPADHLLIERDRGQFVPSGRRRMMANVRAERLRAAYPRRCSSNASGLHGRNSARILGIRASSAGVARASIPAERSWPTPELRIPNAAAQTRIVSKARIRLDSRKCMQSGLSEPLSGSRGSSRTIALSVVIILRWSDLMPRAVLPAEAAACICGGAARSNRPGRPSSRPPSPTLHKRVRPSRAIVPRAHSGRLCWRP